MAGFYLMHRGWRNNPVFAGEPYSRADAWIWLIENAAFAPHQIGIKGKTVTIGRGQLSHSLRHLATTWKWDEAKVRRFLSRIERDEMIRCVADAGQNVITICNYEKYQDPRSVGDVTTAASSTQHRRSTDAIYKEDNNTSPNGEGASAPRNSLEKDYFDKGKKVLGSKAGGVLASLLKAKGSPEAAYGVLIAAEDAQNPMEYVQGAIREKPKLEPKPARKHDPQYDELWAEQERMVREKYAAREAARNGHA